MILLRETSVLSPRLVGGMGGGRASVSLVIGGEDLGDREGDLECTQEGGLVEPPPNRCGIYKNPGGVCCDRGEKGRANLGIRVLLLMGRFTGLGYNATPRHRVN